VNTRVIRSQIGLLREWKREVDSFTLRLIEAIPVDKSSFQPVPSTLTLAEIVFHLADCEMELDRDLIRNLQLSESIPEHSGEMRVESSRVYLKDMLTVSDSILRGLSDSDLCREIFFPGRTDSVTVRHIIKTMIEHQLHHRGQILTYFRCLDLEPPKRWSD
jgi:uncharacterized damage-inducible protein DinB